MTEIHLSDEDKAFIEEQINAARYRNTDEIVAAGLRLLQRQDASLRQLIQEGLDDIEAGRVHHYETGEEFLADIERLSQERRRKTGTGH